MPILEQFDGRLMQCCPVCCEWRDPFEGQVCEMCKARMHTKDGPKPGQVATEEQKHSKLKQLQTEAKIRGFKPGWAAYKFKELFGHWPQR